MDNNCTFSASDNQTIRNTDTSWLSASSLPKHDNQVVVLANGTFPLHTVPLEVLEKANRIVCCDSSFANLPPQFIPKVEAIVGDGDSLSNTLKQQYAHLLHIESEQDTNDLSKATRYCLRQGYRKLAYLGLTGAREDHTLGNLSLLVEYAKQYGIRPIAFTDYGVFMACTGNQSFRSFKNQQVSIFNFGCTQLQSEGLKWDILPFSTWWQGTLNQALSNHFTIFANHFYLVFQTYEGKEK